MSAGGFPYPIGRHDEAIVGLANRSNNFPGEPVGVFDQRGAGVASIQAAGDEDDFAVHFRGFHVVKEIA
jgi:hypothetical protein